MIASELQAGAGQVKITAIKALQPRRGATLVKVETDAGISGYGPCHGSGPFVRAAIAGLEGPRLPHLGLIGKDPLAIEVHFQHMFYSYPQRGRVVGILSAIDIALWDLAGKLLDLPVCRLLGGPFRDKIKLYSHCGGGDFQSRAEWRDRARSMREDPHGFTAYKIDIHHALRGHMQETMPSIGVQEARDVRNAYALAREELGDDIDIIVHCHNELDLPGAIKVAEAVEPIAPLYFEDAIAPRFSEAWSALRRTTRLPLLTGENLVLGEEVLPFLQAHAVDCLQPDLINCGGITGAKRIADLAALYQTPVQLHNVSGYVLNMASAQVSAALFNCPMLECTRNAAEAPEATGDKLIIKDGYMHIAMRPGLGLQLDFDYLKENRAEGEPWWGDDNA
jgi:L-alanine-DL-glutamate epimerase-like enolase superfamily enzyme